MSLETIFFSLLTPLWLLLFHAFAGRLPWRHRLSRQFLATVCGLIATLFVSIAVGYIEKSLSAVLFSAFIALGSSHVYFHFFNMSETARRIFILVNLKINHPTEQKEYSAASMIPLRLQRLIEIKQVEKRGDRYVTTNSILTWAAQFLNWYEQLIYPKRSAPLKTELRV